MDRIWHCCGMDIESRFCPQCGAERHSDLGDLMDHILTAIGACDKRIAGIERKLEQRPMDGRWIESCRRWRGISERAKAKWERWRDALADLMEQK